YLKQDEDPQWGLIRAVEPDVLVLTADHSYTPDQLTALEEVVGEVVVLERQSSVTTSERIRQMYMNLGDKLAPKLACVPPGLIDETLRRGWPRTTARSSSRTSRWSTRATGASSSATAGTGARS